MIVAGFGFRKAAGISALRAALALAQRGQPAIGALAAPQDKADRLSGLAVAMNLPLIAVDQQAMEAKTTITQSSASLVARRAGSVAEAVALAAAGPGARLLGSRHISPDRMATCAIAQGVLP